MSKRILFTGLTGFIGSNIARELVKRGFLIYGLHRNSSSFKRLEDVCDSIIWINIQEKGWIDKFEKLKFDVLIHAAWDGISHSERDNWDIQMRNFEYSKLIFKIAIRYGVKRIISLGSQAEYGLYSEAVSESFVPLPIDAYGSIKLLTLYYLQSLAKSLSIEWYWIRIFSVFGRDENPEWLIPQVIIRLQNNETIELTEGNQIYDYLHTDDFVHNFLMVLSSSSDKSGVYNLCSGTGVEIKNLLKLIAAYLPESRGALDFGKIPYRINQNMFMVGTKNKFEYAFGEMKSTDLPRSLKKTIDYYL
jgi:nucleoside-diphosphate-sugar epimerase